MKASLFDYHLMVVDRKKQTISHHHFYDLPEFLTSNDVLVINQSKVIPARLFGLKSTSGKVEMLLLKKLTPNTWQALTKPGIKVNREIKIIKKPTLNISKTIATNNSLLAKIIKINSDGRRILKFNTKDKKRLFRAGMIPTPPYIKKEGSAAAPTAGFHFTKD